MSLRDSVVGPVVPVSDLAEAVRFYEDVLGLVGERTPGGRVLHAGGDTTISLLEAPEAVATATYPIATFRVADVATAVRDLKDRGVTFLGDAELPFDLDGDDVSRQDGMSVAWFSDPFGQVLTLFSLDG